MKIKCDYCGNTYEDFQKNCPFCGSPNPSCHDSDKQPHTIEELKKWYEARHLPSPETTRFFIGVNYKEAKAFGIYKDDSGDFVVYKNKADGTRAIRYKGKDEAYAVNELYQKLKDEIVHQKSLSSRRRSGTFNVSTGRKRRKHRNVGLIITLVWFCIVCVIGTVNTLVACRFNGYYNYNGTVYYKDKNTWYSYDPDYGSYDAGWHISSEPYGYDPNNRDDYYMGQTYTDAESWNYPERFTDVTESSDYQTHHESSHDSSGDYDSDYDWDNSDSWDSGGTDWDSDW